MQMNSLPIRDNRRSRDSQTAIRAKHSRGGFTLIELLIVVTIIATLAAMMMFGLAGARAAALEKKTKVVVKRLNEALMSRYRTYETRRISWQEGRGPTAAMGPAQAARMRLDALRELMRLEMPQAFSEVTGQPTSGVVRPAASQAYQRRIAESKAIDGNPSNKHKDFATYAGAECLYLILTTRMGEEESIRDSMKDSEVGDKDEDGMKEFLDGFGNPICFIRWPTGFESELQPQEARANPRLEKWHDPFDPQMLDDKAFALFPLIYSAGRDQKYDIHHKISGNMNKPYENTQMGVPMDEDGFGYEQDQQMNDSDNIHNHMAL